MARKRKSRPTKGGVTSGRGEKQRVKDRLSHAQDDARRLEILGNDPLPPEESLRPERVDPSSQEQLRFPRLIGVAVRRGWATPDERKPGLVDELIGVVEDPDAKPFDKIAAFGTLTRADQIQHERDQEYIRVDRVLAMWKGVLEAIRNHVQDQALVKLIVADVLRFLPAPQGKLGLGNEETTVGGVEGHAANPES